MNRIIAESAIRTQPATDIMRRILDCALLLLVCVAPIAFAKPTNITKEEMALTASFCPDTEAFSGAGEFSPNRTAKSYRWEAAVGKGFWSLHHYCWAQINTRRALRSGVLPEIRKGLLINVIDDYWYVIRNTPADFPLLPDVYTRIGDAELVLANPNNADRAFAKARELKPDYWPAYSRWAEFLITTGKRREARELVRMGLEFSPTAKVLIEQYRRLGGNPDEIAPRPSPNASSDPPATAAPSDAKERHTARPAE